MLFLSRESSVSGVRVKDKTGLHKDKEKVEAIVKMPNPETTTHFAVWSITMPDSYQKMKIF